MVTGKWVASVVTAVALTACATANGPFAGSGDAYGIVDLDIAQHASRQYEAYFLEVDGINLVPDRKQLLLKPGKHTLRLGAKLDNLYSSTAMSVPGSRNSERSTVTIEVKEGMRYSVAAKLDGTFTHQWQAIVSREAPLTGYAVR